MDTYLAASEEVIAAGGARVRLGDNYRATPALVAATNSFFDQDAPDPIFTGDVTYAPSPAAAPIARSSTATGSLSHLSVPCDSRAQ